MTPPVDAIPQPGPLGLAPSAWAGRPNIAADLLPVPPSGRVGLARAVGRIHHGA